MATESAEVAVLQQILLQMVGFSLSRAQLGRADGQIDPQVTMEPQAKAVLPAATCHGD